MANRDSPKKSKYTESSCFRNFTFLIYPDSAPVNWFQVLDEMQIPAAVSPLHIGEVKEDGSPKKPHYHVVLMYSQKHSIGQALEVVDEIKGVPDLTHNFKKFVVGDLKKMLRYLCHLDNKEKLQFSIEDVRTLGPINYGAAIAIDDDIVDILVDITFFVYDNHITNFSSFMSWCGENNRKWFEIGSMKATYYLATLIKTEAYNEGRKE